LPDSFIGLNHYPNRAPARDRRTALLDLDTAPLPVRPPCKTLAADLIVRAAAASISFVDPLSRHSN
jgi:hypothetical protein